MNRRWMATATAVGAASLAFSAAALAQTATPGATTTAQATGTVTAGATGTRTAGATGTVTAGATGTVTAGATRTVTGTVSVQPPLTPVPLINIPAALYVPGGGPFDFAHSGFGRTWVRTDMPVATGRVNRSWFWGPGPNTPGLIEQYNESGWGGRQRLVQYFDKSRMEINDPNADPSQPFFVTNGLLTVELIGGFIQVGDDDFVQFRPACIPMTGDFGNTTAVTYAAFQQVSNTQAEDNPAPNRVGQTITATISATGTVGTLPTGADLPGVQIAQYITETQHNIPTVFWDFLNQQGQVVRTPVTMTVAGTVTETIAAMPNPQVVTETLITPWFFASGLPISEAYWTRAPINGQMRDVLVQAYERRTLTYVPTNPAGFQVEMGNIGQHYFDWRYRNAGVCPGTPAGTPTPPMPAPTGTVVAGTPVTGTATAVRTGTVVTGTATPQRTGTVTAQATGTVVSTPVGTGTPASASPTATTGGVPQPIPVTPTSTP